MTSHGLRARERRPGGKLATLQVKKKLGVSQVELVVKSPPANARDLRDEGSIPGWGRSPRGEHGNPLEHSCQRIPWTEEPDGLWSTGLQRVRHCFVTEPTHTHGSPGTQSFQAARASNTKYEGRNKQNLGERGSDKTEAG